MGAATKTTIPLEPRLREHLARLFPGRRVLAIEPLAPDTGATSGATQKAAGYGLPVRIVLAGDHGAPLELVWRVATANAFGHDRRADRAASMIQAFDDFIATPGHVAPLDLGVMRYDGSLQSIRDASELYLITGFAQGTLYAEDLRRIVGTCVANATDLARIDALIDYLVALHVPLSPPGTRYRRAIRDLVGSGEGIFGIIDGYPASVPGATALRLHELEQLCEAWRWRLREHDDRLTRTHGDFHPFNIVFGPGDVPTLLDASRGACGDPADDLTAMAINFLLFAVDRPAAWAHGFGPLWRRWWDRYLTKRDDPEVLDVAPPFLAWRALVVANPVFYPNLTAHGRDQLLGFAEDVLRAGTLDPVWAEELFP